jgi:hypothetical protein
MQRLRAGAFAAFDLGSSVSGPWALRPKRLQWLTNITAGFKIAAFPVLMDVRSHSLSSVMPAQAGTQLFPFKTGRKLGPGLRRGDGVKCGDPGGNNTSRALPQFSFYLRILIGRKAMAETVPPIFSNREHNSS